MVWQPGQKLQGGKYEIIKVLGRGGFGITYHARHIHLNTEVVIKTPDLLQKKDIEYEQYVQQFQEEAQRLAKFSAKPHPHIVKVRDYFLEDTLPCLVMDFIRGDTLMEIIKTQGPLSEVQCLIYIRQIGKALETIHKAKMVHRDAHPGNIMIQDGQAILIDFGIAKNIIPATHSITDSAANPSFAPYEQIYRGSKERQYTIDVYTLAATFYYAVTGKRPPQPPPAVAPQYQKEVIKPTQSPKSNNISRSSRHQSRKISWINLIIHFLYEIFSIVLIIIQWINSLIIKWIRLIILFLISGTYSTVLETNQSLFSAGVLVVAVAAFAVAAAARNAGNPACWCPLFGSGPKPYRV